MTKKNRIEHMQRIISKYQPNQKISADDLFVINLLCNSNETKFWVITSPQNRTNKCLVTTNPNKNPANSFSSNSWSWRDAINGYTPLKNRLQALRTASRKGSLSNFKKTNCENCGTDLNLQIDHKTTPFSEIVRRFYQSHGKPEIVHSTAKSWHLVDEHQFIQFHDQIADYQTLCGSCNQSKGDK